MYNELNIKIEYSNFLVFLTNICHIINKYTHTHIYVKELSIYKTTQSRKTLSVHKYSFIYALKISIKYIYFS